MPAKRTAPKKRAAAKKPARRPERGVSFDAVREVAMALPGVEEGTSYGTPAFRVRGKLFARLHDSGESLVVRIELDDREGAMAADPETFFITDHYRNAAMMLVHLGHVSRAVLEDSIVHSYRMVAPKKLLAELDAGA